VKDMTMKGYEWKEGTPVEVSKDGAYWERNMLALAYAKSMNRVFEITHDALAKAKVEVSQEDLTPPCGWYFDTDNNWDGWHRVISLDDGTITFHIPDEFELGNLPEIKANWDGHTTRQKWDRIAKDAEVSIDWE
jgi:hypothetical protein